MNPNLPIGLFDSGVGGMTVLRAMRALMPEEDYVYLGDTARLPYGTKSGETITRYALQASAKLVEQNIKFLVVACNTVSAVALPALRAAFPHMPVVGVVEPGAQAACAASVSGRIAVLATESTIRGQAYEAAIWRLRPEATVLSQACPLFVPLAEDGLTSGPLVEGIAARYLDPLFAAVRKAGQEVPDCVVLGCTHFPLLAEALGAVIGGHVRLVDSAATTAQTVCEQLQLQHLSKPLLGKKAPGQTRFLTTDDVARFAKMGERFLGIALPEGSVQLVDL